MKPIKLTMTAFGPYRETEIIDFKDLQGQQLFVVSGKTGAGKTTIFDAICFALYGNASGEDRNDVRMLRSDFAKDDVHTSVDFLFSLKGKVYRVFRQIAHIKEGNKSATGDKYELYECKGEEEIPLTDRFIVSQIDGKIMEIIGLTKDQFSQIIMLPQGEFRKLLTSETENKEEVLRKIFKTTYYRNIADRLNQKRKENQQLFDSQVKERDFYEHNILSSLPPRENTEWADLLEQEYKNTYQVIQALDKEIDFYKKETERQEVSFEEKEKGVKKKTEQFHKAQSINQRFQLLEQKKHLHNELISDKEKMIESENKIKLSESAKQLLPYEKQNEELKKEVHTKRLDLEQITTQLKESKTNLTNAQKLYDEEIDRKPEREKVTKELDRIEEYLPTVREIDIKKKEIITLNLTVEKDEENKNKLETLYKEQKAKKDELSEKRKELDEEVYTLTEKMDEINDLGEKSKKTQEYLDWKSKKEKLSQQLKIEKEKVTKIENQLRDLEKLWMEGQASILAGHLHDGQPCPVCGSVDHPNKAIKTVDTPTKEEIDKLRLEKDEMEKHYNQVLAEFNLAEKSIHDREKELIQLGFHVIQIQKEHEHIQLKGSKLKREIMDLREKQKILTQVRKQLQDIESDLEIKFRDIEKLTSKLHENKTSYETKKSVYEESLKKIPNELRDLKTLTNHQTVLQKQKEKMENDWERVQTNLQKSKEHLAIVRTKQENSLLNVKDLEQKSQMAEKEFLEAVHSSGFTSLLDYQNAKMSDHERQELKQKIEDYYTNLKTVLQQIKELEEELKDDSKSDLSILEQELQVVSKELEENRKILSQLKSYLDKAIEGRKLILEANEKVKDIEKHLENVKDLYDVIRGENSRKISFERYLQIEFLEQIIQSANERLAQLSNGQYYLVRSDRLEKRGRQSGLGLDVYDNYTGQVRDVKTLSGGEKFNASLCLALGMADVIQSYEGGISIETMFIDEGFGSLDEESLNKAIETLISLQKTGRMIGIISHVQELKQAIPAILEVEKMKEGYSRTKFIIK
ncbi:SMC family ATPase [Bacillaceae bacterium S4-13-56]